MSGVQGYDSHRHSRVIHRPMPESEVQAVSRTGPGSAPRIQRAPYEVAKHCHVAGAQLAPGGVVAASPGGVVAVGAGLPGAHQVVADGGPIGGRGRGAESGDQPHPGAVRWGPAPMRGWVGAHRRSQMRRASNRTLAPSSSKMITHPPVTCGSRMISSPCFSATRFAKFRGPLCSTQVTGTALRFSREARAVAHQPWLTPLSPGRGIVSHRPST